MTRSSVVEGRPEPRSRATAITDTGPPTSNSRASPSHLSMSVLAITRTMRQGRWFWIDRSGMVTGNWSPLKSREPTRLRRASVTCSSTATGHVLQARRTAWNDVGYRTAPAGRRSALVRRSTWPAGSTSPPGLGRLRCPDRRGDLLAASPTRPVQQPRQALLAIATQPQIHRRPRHPGKLGHLLLRPTFRVPQHDPRPGGHGRRRAHVVHQRRKPARSPAVSSIQPDNNTTTS